MRRCERLVRRGARHSVRPTHKKQAFDRPMAQHIRRMCSPVCLVAYIVQMQEGDWGTERCDPFQRLAATRWTLGCTHREGPEQQQHSKAAVSDLAELPLFAGSRERIAATETAGAMAARSA